MMAIKAEIKQVLTKEVGLKVHGERFYDRWKTTSYPIKVVIFNNKAKLGYFESEFYEMGFHERLMKSSKKQLGEIIRHELAHYLNYINFGTYVEPHGVEFKQLCKSLGWGPEVSDATILLEEGQFSIDNDVDCDQGILRKVQKLMSLASSSNTHEAELAMLKSQQLLLKHNIDEKYVGDMGEEKIFRKRILKERKENAKMRSIAHILDTFFVSTVYYRTAEFTYLEIMGNAVNLQIAEYVAEVLKLELDRLWEIAKKEHQLKGQIAKNCFFSGVAKGYCNKVSALKKDYSQEVANALIVLDKKLIDAKAMVYGRLSSQRSSGSFCPESSSLGEKMGRQLNIRSGLNESAKQNALYLT
jgi:hypothetical protein